MLSPYLDEISSLRLVVLLEKEPLSDAYSQLILNAEQFKQLSALLESFMPHQEDGGFTVECEDDVVILPESVTSFKEI